MSNDGPMPASLGRYRVLRRLGTGGMAEVFLAKSRGAEGIEKVLVVKRILPSFAKSTKFISMFVDEAKVVMRLNHPNLVQVYAFEEVGGEFLLAMEFVDGLDLGRLLTAARKVGVRLPYELAAYIVMELARGLDYAHRRRDEAGEPMDIVHRDVSPQNVLISFDGVVKATDFGIAKARLVSEDEGVIKGKFGYMSPEQAQGARVDRRSDVYALGILLAELLMDRSMFPGLVGLDLLDRVRDGEIVLPRSVDPAVPAELERVVRRATARDPEERFQTARSLAGALTQYLHGQMELVDGEALERFITKIAPRDFTLPEGFPAPVFHSAALGMDSTEFSADRETRDRRRVVVVAGRLRGQTGEDGPVGRSAARVLEDIAYKADAVLSWPDGDGRARFRYVIGLGKASVNDPLRACSLALDIVEALQGLSADLLMPLGASIGISRGLVSTAREKGGRLLGYEPVDRALEVAERLADAGGPDEVLAAGEVYRMVRRDFAFDDVRERHVPVVEDGAETIRAFALRGAFSREERVAVLRGREGARAFVGREEEIHRIEELYATAVAGRRTLFAGIVGDLGVGKSALIRAAVRKLGPPPRVLRSECAFYTADVPYAIAADLVREACRISDDMTLDQARARLSATATELIEDPERRRSVVEGLDPLLHLAEKSGTLEDAEERGRRMMVGVQRLLQALALRGPLVITADAMHWADSASLELLRQMMLQSYEVPCLVLLGARPDARVERLLAEVPRLELGELDDAERRQLISARFAGAAVPEEVEDAVASRAGGNPFFVLELVDTLLERGVLGVEGEGTAARVARRPGVPIALPTTLEGVISARIDDLGEGARRSLRWLAVAGTGIKLEELSAIAGSSLVEDFAELEVRGLVRRGSKGSYGFTSAVVRQVAYEGTDARDRTRMHKRIAELLRARPGVAPGRVARHLERAGELAAAAGAYLEAAEGARRVYSNQEALRFYAHALRLLPEDPVRRFQAHSGRERILRFLGRRQDQATELAAMRRIAEAQRDAASLALALVRLTRFELDGNRLAAVPELLARALASAEEAADLSLQVDALRLSAELAQYEGRFDRALEDCDRALARAGTSADLLSARGSVLVQRAILLRRTDRLDEALAAHAEAVVIFRRLGVKRHEAVALGSLGTTLADAGAYEDALEVIRASIELDGQTGDRLRLGRKLAALGKLHFLLGDVERGLEHTERALRALDQVDDRVGSADALCIVADIYLSTRGPDAALEPLDAARLATARTPISQSAVRERLLRARVHRAAGRPGAAEDEARAALEAARGLSLGGLHVEAGVHLSAALLERANTEEAARLARVAFSQLHTGVTLERAEGTHAELGRVLEALGFRAEAETVRTQGVRLVEQRAARLRDPRRRAAYLATPPVGALTRAVPASHL